MGGNVAAKQLSTFAVGLTDAGHVFFSKSYALLLQIVWLSLWLYHFEACSRLEILHVSWRDDESASHRHSCEEVAYFGALAEPHHKQEVLRHDETLPHQRSCMGVT